MHMNLNKGIYSNFKDNLFIFVIAKYKLKLACLKYIKNSAISKIFFYEKILLWEVS